MKSKPYKYNEISFKTIFSKISNGDSSKSAANNNQTRNNNVRNVYNNPQIPSMATYNARMKSNPNLMSSAARRSGNYPQGDFTKRQKNLIRVAVNSNASNSTPSVPVPSPQPGGQILTPMSELHLHDFPSPEILNQDHSMRFGYATGGNKIGSLVTASGQQMSAASHSNPEISSVLRSSEPRSLHSSDYNSDSEILQTNPPALRLSKGTLVKKLGNGPDIAGSYSAVKNLAALEGVAESESAEEKSVSPLKNSQFVRPINSSRINQRTSNVKGKPPPSRLPVRSHGKPFITPHISKPPAVLHRGRSISNPHFIPTYSPGFGRPSIVGSNTGPTQVVIGSGGTVSIPANPSQSSLTRILSSIDMSSSYPINTSVYTSSPGLTPFQPLSVSQKPLMLPPQKDPELSPSRHDGVIQDANDSSQGSEKNRNGLYRSGTSGKKSGKRRSNSRRGSVSVNGDQVAGSKNNSVRKNVPGKKKPKFKSMIRKPSSSKNNFVNGNASAEENEIGDVPIFQSPAKSDPTPVSSASADLLSDIPETKKYPLIAVSDITNYKVVMDVENLLEVSEPIQA